MYCPSCGNEITVELKYCNRCGANLSSFSSGLPAPVVAPIKLTLPTLLMGLTIIGGLGIIFGGATEFARIGVHPAAITWMVIFSLATLFGCTSLLIRFWSKLIFHQRELQRGPQNIRTMPERNIGAQLPPHREPIGSVTENTTRTFSPIYREPSDRGPR
jgi:hypothetical protein